MSHTELALQVVPIDTFAARELGITFSHGGQICLAQRLISTTLYQKMEESTCKGPVGLREHVNQRVKFLVGAHALIANAAALS